MSEYLFDDAPDRITFIRPDPEGFTLRTRMKGTQDILDQNARERTGKHHPLNLKGSASMPVCRVPAVIYELWSREMGRELTAWELVKRCQQPEYQHFMLTDKEV
jgi:hypothetical protein